MSRVLSFLQVPDVTPNGEDYLHLLISYCDDPADTVSDEFCDETAKSCIERYGRGPVVPQKLHIKTYPQTAG